MGNGQLRWLDYLEHHRFENGAFWLWSSIGNLLAESTWESSAAARA
jgi:hypothetical protein